MNGSRKHFVFAGMLVVALTAVLYLGMRAIGLLPTAAAVQAEPIERLFYVHFFMIALLFSLIGGNVPAMRSTRERYASLLAALYLLSMLLVPLLLTTLYAAFRRNFERHKWVVRFTFPVWLVVSVTGILVYLLLRHQVGAPS